MALAPSLTFTPCLTYTIVPQVYKAKLRSNGEEVAIKVQRPGIEPVIFRDLWLVRSLSFVINAAARKRVGCAATVIVDEFGEKLLQARRPLRPSTRRRFLPLCGAFAEE